MTAATTPKSDAVAFSFKDISFTWGEVAIVGGCGLLILIIFVGLLVYISRRSQEQIMGGAEEDFERNLLRELTPKVEATSAVEPTPAVAKGSESSPNPLPSSPPAEGAPAEDALVGRLRGMGLLGAFQGSQSLGFGPDAQIYALKGGGTVLILPRMESEAYLSHATKTHTMVVAPTSDGTALMITQLGQKVDVSVQRVEGSL